MPIDCPGASESVAAHAASAPWICVNGTLATPPSPSAAAAPPGQRAAAAPTVSVSVMVFAGHGVSPPTDPPPGATSATISGSDWSATLVSVSSAGTSLPGAPQTVVAWQVGASGVEERAITEFFTVDDTVSGATDCCGSSGADSVAAGTRELASAGDLDVVIPDGPNKGAHTAKAAGPRNWRVHVGKEQYTLHHGRRLVIRGRSYTVVPRAVEASPFSATFPGAIFGATGDVVVTIA